MAAAIALLGLGAGEVAAEGRSGRRPVRKPPVTARAARSAITRALIARPEPGLRPADLGKVRVVGIYRKGEGRGVANSTGFVAETTIVAAEFISPSHPWAAGSRPSPSPRRSARWTSSRDTRAGA